MANLNEKNENMTGVSGSGVHSAQAAASATLSGTIAALMESKKYATVRDILLTMQPVDIAALFEELYPQKLSLIFRLLPKDLASDTFVEMSSELQAELIRCFSDRELKDVLDELYMDDTVDLVEEMPASIVKRILSQANPEERQLINEMLKYPADSAGSIMTTEFVDLYPNMTVAAAIEHIRETGVDKETINVCYVTNKSRQLIGEVSIRSLILADSASTVEDIMTKNTISVPTHEDKENVAHVFTKYGCIVVPVVDSEERLVGIVTVDDAITVIRDEATEDIDVMAAITPSDKPYLKQSAFHIYLSRIPWLMLLMISATFTGSIITHFEDALSAYIILAASIPMLMDTGGNCGSQASVTVIRGISLQEIQFRDTFRVLWKEFRVSLLCGITLAVVNFGKLMLINRVTVPIAAVISLTLLFTVFFAKLVGCFLPILAKKLGFDPAVMASPFITTIVDALSLFIYFQMATIILGI